MQPDIWTPTDYAELMESISQSIKSIQSMQEWFWHNSLGLTVDGEILNADLYNSLEASLEALTLALGKAYINWQHLSASSIAFPS